MTKRKDNDGWAAVPGVKERAPLLEIVIFLGVLGVLFGTAVVAVCLFLLGLAAVL